MLTHANIIASAAGGSETLQDVGPTDVHVSYLPLAHIYERSNVSFLTRRGAAIGSSCVTCARSRSDVRSERSLLTAQVESPRVARVPGPSASPPCHAHVTTPPTVISGREAERSQREAAVEPRFQVLRLPCARLNSPHI